MSTRHLPRAPTVVGNVEARASARRLASRILVELDFADVVVTPRTFELWHVHLSAATPELSRQLQALLRQPAPPSAEALDALYVEHIAPEKEEHSILEDAEMLRQEAQAMIEDIAANDADLRRHGKVLSDCSANLQNARTVTSLACAVETLTVETARAAEQNRALEQQLMGATARVARLKESLSNVKREAMTDGLTGLCNRKAFEARLRRAISTAKADSMPVSVLLLDVDHFKRVNDTHGHQVGDLVLRLIGRLLGENVKGRDTAARHSGEEFAIILAGAGLRAGMTVAEQIRSALESTSFGKKGSGSELKSVTISIGVAELRPADTGAALMGRADKALYEAKRAGRNQVCAEMPPAAADYAGMRAG